MKIKKLVVSLALIVAVTFSTVCIVTADNTDPGSVRPLSSVTFQLDK